MGRPGGARGGRGRRCWLGTGLAGLVNVFNPQRVVLGGLLGDHVAVR